MAVLDSTNRQACADSIMRDFDLRNETFGSMTKADLRAAVDAIDQFLEDNKTTINAAIPQPARGQMTVKQKAKLLVRVVQQRFLTGN